MNAATAPRRTTNPAGGPLAQETAQALLALYSQGRIAETLAEAKALAADHPGIVFLHNIIGACHAAQNEPDDAIAAYRRALKLQPESAELRNNLGNALNLAGSHREAASELAHALDLRPDYPEAWRNLSNARFDLKEYDTAAEALEKVVELQPENAQAIFNLGVVLVLIGLEEAAIKRFREVIALVPDHAAAHNNLGKLLTAAGETDAAFEALGKAISLQPGYLDAINNLGLAFSGAGAFDEARTCYRKAIELEPGAGEAYARLCGLSTVEAGDPLIAAMEANLAGAATPDDRMHFHFALGKALDDTGDTDGAFAHFEAANRIGREGNPFDIEQERELFDRIVSVVSAIDEPLTLEDIETAPFRPVFIVGMPRSGTSLVEQILASHSQVFGGGELSHMQWAAAPLMREAPQTVGKAELLDLRRSYMDKLAALGRDEPVITDKMPSNFRSIGFIAAAFPDATIIHLRRDPVAVGWSIFRSHLAADGLTFAFDLDDIAAYYRLYQDLMDYWHQKLPGRIRDIDYEALTENQEAETRSLLEACGLGWEDACLSFHETERTVTTTSAAQVREEMYTGSSDAWRRYEAHLRPLIEGLRG